jgi:hypothetical protein
MIAGNQKEDGLIQRDIGDARSLYLIEAVNYIQAAELKVGHTWDSYVEIIIDSLHADYAKPDKREMYFKLG